jgi:hypothetical protein
MRRKGLWWAVAIVVLANLAAWSAAALNRRGEPEAVLVLTERELRLPAKQTENTALTLSLVFEPRRPRPAGEPREAGWFDRAKLQSIGFDCSRPVTADNAAYYRARPPRATYAALEYEGEMWRRQLERPAQRADSDSAAAKPAGSSGTGASGQAPFDPLLDSHLVVIDVDNDPAALRQRYPDRHRVAVVEATAALLYAGKAGGPPFLAGRITSVLPGDINVPREWRRVLEGLQADARPDSWPPPPREPRFRATIAWGRRLEPRVTSVELLRPESAR